MLSGGLWRRGLRWWQENRVAPAWGCPYSRSGLCCFAPPCLYPPPVCAGLEEFGAGLWCVNSRSCLLRLRSPAASHVSARLHPRLGEGTCCHFTSAQSSPEPSASASGVRECMKTVMTSMEYSWDIHGHCVWLNKVRRALLVLAPAFLPVTSHSWEWASHSGLLWSKRSLVERLHLLCSAACYLCLQNVSGKCRSEGLCSAAFLSEFTFIVVKSLKYSVEGFEWVRGCFYFSPCHSLQRK